MAILKQRGDYHDLVAYQKAECVYDVTYYFVEHFLKHDIRTHSQMLQAARSAKQNLIEGMRDATASSKLEINLLNTALGSLSELRADYEDYLRVRGLELKPLDSEWSQAMRKACPSTTTRPITAVRLRGKATRTLPTWPSRSSTRLTI